MDRRIISQSILVALFALTQNTTLLSLGGIKINLVLILILSLAFMVRNWAEYLFLVILSSIFLKVEHGWDWGVIAFILVVLAVYFLKKFLPWQLLINYLFFVFLSTSSFYLILDWHFIQNNFLIFFKELIYNLVFGGLLYLILIRFYDEGTRTKF